MKAERSSLKMKDEEKEVVVVCFIIVSVLL